jgi:glyoxylase-like metal-dependent hydrolase (beta-lactamase superfamily II)
VGSEPGSRPAAARRSSPTPHGIGPIELPTPFAVGTVNVYLIEDRPLTLVDAGPNYPEALGSLTAGLAARGHRLEEIELLLLTHQHYDHIGLAATVKEQSGAEVAALKPLSRFLADCEASMQAEDEFQAGVIELHGVPRTTIDTVREVSRGLRGPGRSVEVDRRLEAGDVIELAGRTAGRRRSSRQPRLRDRRLRSAVLTASR